MNWITIAISAVSGLSGALIGAFGITWRLAARFQRIDDRLNGHDKRLDKGNPGIDAIPVITTKLDMFSQTLRELTVEVKEMRKEVVTHGECDRRHATARSREERP